MRFNVAIVSEQLCRFTTPATAKEKLGPMLETLAGDADVDVKYFAEKSLTVIRAS